MDNIPFTLTFLLIDNHLSLNILRNSCYDWMILSLLSVALIEANRSTKTFLPYLYFLTFYKNVAVLLFHFNGRDIPLLVSIIIASFSLMRTAYLNKEKLVKFFRKEKNKPEESLSDMITSLIQNQPKRQEDGYARLFENMDWNDFFEALKKGGASEGVKKENGKNVMDYVHVDWNKIMKTLMAPKNEEKTNGPPTHDISDLMNKVVKILYSPRKEEKKQSDEEINTINYIRGIMEGKIEIPEEKRCHLVKKKEAVK